jgi:hypothetical protein
MCIVTITFGEDELDAEAIGGEVGNYAKSLGGKRIPSLRPNPSKVGSFLVDYEFPDAQSAVAFKLRFG